MIALLLAAALSQQAPERPRFSDRSDVSRVLLEARVVDAAGQPVRGLTAADLRLTVDGRPVPVDALEWVPGSVGTVPAGAAPAGPAAVTAPGRLIVLVFQKDLDGSRVVGLLRMIREAGKLVSRLGPDDRVAVLSFDTHLRLWEDFTRDEARLRRAMEGSLLFGGPGPADLPEDPSLRASFDAVAALRAASMEEGLSVIAKALLPLAGAKDVVLFGWGLGHGSAAWTWLGNDYERAALALGEAHATVYALDVTEADAHTLAFGLQRAAADTGGFYASTYNFPAQAIARLEGALAGHYLVGFESPTELPGFHAVRLSVAGRRAEVLTRAGYVQ